MLLLWMSKNKQEKSDLWCIVSPGENTTERTQRQQAGSRTMIALSKHLLKCFSHAQVYCSLYICKHTQATAVVILHQGAMIC